MSSSSRASGPTFYAHSGALPPAGLALTLAAGLVSAVVLGYLYSLILVACPSVYFSIFLTITLAIGIGFAVATSAEIGKLRSAGVPLMITLGAGFLGLSVAWGADIGVRGFWENGSFTLAPGTILAYIGELNAAGAWTVGDSETPVRGFMLTLVWLVEALIIVGGALLTCSAIEGGSVFCERCNDWVHSEPLDRIIDRDCSGELVAQVLAGRVVETINRAREANPSARSFVRVELTCCTTCESSNYLTLVGVSTSVDDEGEETVDETPMITNLRISSPVVACLRDPSRIEEPESSRAAAGKDRRRRRPRARREARDRREDRAARSSNQKRRAARARSDRPARQGRSGAPKAIDLECPHCQKVSRIPGKYAGRTGLCPRCKEPIQVPSAGELAKV